MHNYRPLPAAVAQSSCKQSETCNLIWQKKTPESRPVHIPSPHFPVRTWAHDDDDDDDVPLFSNLRTVISHGQVAALGPPQSG
jgi:hypothetical protein